MFPLPPKVQQIGNAWAAARRSVVLKVPSVIVPDEWNYLLNPTHPNFAEIVIGPRKPFVFAPRLIGKN